MLKKEMEVIIKQAINKLFYKVWHLLNSYVPYVFWNPFILIKTFSHALRQNSKVFSKTHFLNYLINCDYFGVTTGQSPAGANFQGGKLK